MTNKMTILEAIHNILQQNPNGMTSQEIYQEIVKQELYKFGAKNPSGLVNGLLRRQCLELDFPTSSPIKKFKIAGYKGKRIKFCLLNSNPKDEILPKKSTSITSVDILPEEKIEIALNEHLHQVKQQLLSQILDQDPRFFEYLVVDLLLKIGYGYDSNSGNVTGFSHDGGIDGIISQDKLGLDLIYLQAKRYKEENKVGRKEIQSFIGAMSNVQKGVFITTSKFTKEATEFIASGQQKSIKLIDGDLLVDLMINHQVGIESVQTFNIYKIDQDYFNL